ncbi:type IV pilus secretin PilQ [Vibrio ostreicida]|uniref:Type IV pilus secretin PilQ n=1 Tax=Vibrio ostreicida TaxID=526588 RepID=A0ABT8BQK6_9VIBR|nr:type IV pilus secretin PilQ [Vibrio ostreicida]MDN3608407.1 type IV pilus secretin PilQ [Vibrio ostreicida]
MKESVLRARYILSIDRVYHLVFMLFLVTFPPWANSEGSAIPLSKAEETMPLMTVNFQDLPIREAFQQVADYHKINVVISDSVSGRVTLKLSQMRWQSLFEILLRVKGLEQRTRDNVVFIAPAEEFAAQDSQRKAQIQAAYEAGALESENYSVKFANASELATILGGEDSRLLTKRGALRADERTNTLLIRDVADNISTIKAAIKALDVPAKQVQIEARIVTLNQIDLQELGIHWRLSSLNVNPQIGHGGMQNAHTLSLYGQPESSLGDFLNINFSAPSGSAATVAFQLAKLGRDTLLDLELSALQRESKVEVISSPRLITTNKNPAYIEQGAEIPFLESSKNGATSVKFKKAALSLKVTPHITSNQHLTLELNLTQDRPGQVVKTGNGEAVAIETQRISTQVLVENGETIVLGGIYQQSTRNTIDKVPLLGDIPFLGGLFRRKYQKMGKSELMIFVTPRVINP